MSTDLGRLADAVKTRRLALYPSRLAAARAAEVSKGTWQRVEEGLGVQDGSYAKIEKALKWAPLSCAAILEGGAPVLAEGVEGEPGTVSSKIPAADLDEARDVVQLAAIATTGLPADQIRELANRAVRDLRKRGII